MDSFFKVNAFTTQLSGGNPAGVVITESEWNAEKMQQMAIQNNLPATAFMYAGESGFGLRWFTVKKELALCGHATLASAHILFSRDIVPKTDKIHFITGKGDLYAWYKNGWTTIDFPAYECEDTSIPEDLLQVFGKQFQSAYKSQDKLLIELKDEKAVRDYKPDFPGLLKYKCVITAATEAGSPYDFVSRFFDQPDGVPEDAVTGSSHCSLATLWGKKLGKNKLDAYQASSRGGELKLTLDNQRVHISGQALTIIEGRYLPFIQKE